mgnify:CR=1 FL=1
MGEQYLQVVSALADSVPSEKERLSLYRRLYAEYEDLPGHAAQAAECLEKILKIDTTAEDAYRGLERLYGKDKNWTALIATYERHIERSEGGKVELLAALARVYEQDLPAGDAEVLVQAHAATARLLVVASAEITVAASGTDCVRRRPTTGPGEMKGLRTAARAQSPGPNKSPSVFGPADPTSDFIGVAFGYSSAIRSSQ